MLRSVKDFYGHTIRSTDGDIGKICGFYFDEHYWAIRYFVVETGDWLSGRRVLISPAVISQADGDIFTVSLTKEQVENSPNIDVDKPVSRQQERELHKYYGWPIYWIEVAHRGKEKTSTDEDEDDFHLRNTREVIGYNIQTSDSKIGDVEDFIIDDEEWVIRYIVADTRKWDKKVIFSPQWCELVDWEESKINLDLIQDSIKDSPEFNPSEPVNREYEDKLYDYYGQPKYWIKPPLCGKELTIWQGKRISHIVGFATDSLKLGYPPTSPAILKFQGISIRDKFNALRESRAVI